MVLLFLIVWVFTNGGSASVTAEKELVLGVAPEDYNYYKKLLSSSSIRCKDGSKKFTKSQLNDDFCDCPDASDEPGTSACPNGQFHCNNAGHIPLLLYSSRVNDGICDCCDGSDEYDGKIKCSNTCWVAGKVARDKLKKKIAVYQEGLVLRRQNIEQAKLSLTKEEAELAKLKNEEKILKGLVLQLKDHKEQIEKVEEKERLQKEKEEMERKEAEEASQKEQKAVEEAETSEGQPENNDAQDRIGLLDGPPSVQILVEDSEKSEREVKNDDHLVEKEIPSTIAEPAKVDPSQQEEKTKSDGEAGVDAGIAGIQKVEATENTDSLSREDLGRLVASRWTGEKTEEQIEEASNTQKKNHGEHEEISNDSYEEEYNGYDSEDNEGRYDDDDDDDAAADGDADVEDRIEDLGVVDTDDSSSSYKYDSDDEPDNSDTTISEPSWLEKIQSTVRSIFQAVNLFKTPVDKSEAERVRKEFDESSAKLSKLQSRISSLTQKLKQDFGPEKEFYSFYGQCFEGRQNKYVYKICPYKQASQVEGHSTTRLGSWEKFEDSYRVMQFMNGDKCWNGPDRSLKVKLRCGLKEEVTDVDEPSRCEYVAMLSTPAICVEEKLKELQDKLDVMNKQQPTSHDEL